MKHRDIETLPQVSQLKLDLIAGKALISDQDHWCQGRFYRAGRFCSVGALLRTLPDDDARLKCAYDALSIREDIQIYNDKHTHAEVMAVWNQAIARA